MQDREERREVWVIAGLVLTAILVGIAVWGIRHSDESECGLLRPGASPTAGLSPIVGEIGVTPSPTPWLSPTSTPVERPDEFNACGTPVLEGQGVGWSASPIEPGDILQSEFAGIKPMTEPDPDALALFWLGEGEQVEVVDGTVVVDEECTSWAKIRRLGTDPMTGWIQLELFSFVVRPPDLP